MYYSTEHDAGAPPTSSQTHTTPQRYLWVGLGKEKDATLNSVRKSAAKFVEKLRELKLKQATVMLDVNQMEHLVKTDAKGKKNSENNFF